MRVKLEGNGVVNELLLFASLLAFIELLVIRLIYASSTTVRAILHLVSLSYFWHFILNSPTHSFQYRMIHDKIHDKKVHRYVSLT